MNELDELRAEVVRLGECLGSSQRYIEEIQARQLAVLAVLRLAVQHHPNAEAMRAALPATAELFERDLLFSPMSDPLRESVHETMRSLMADG